jgi:hypothetical protein
MSLQTTFLAAAGISRSQVAVAPQALLRPATFTYLQTCSCVHNVPCIALLLLLPQPIGITEKISKRWAPSQVRVSVRYIPVGSEEVRRLATAAEAAAAAGWLAGSFAAQHGVQLAALQFRCKSELSDGSSINSTRDEVGHERGEAATPSSVAQKLRDGQLAVQQLSDQSSNGSSKHGIRQGEAATPRGQGFQ